MLTKSKLLIMSFRALARNLFLIAKQQILQLRFRMTINLGAPNQTGFSPIILVALLAAGIITGTILVQQGSNIFSRAAEQEGLNPSAGKTQKCSDIPQGDNVGRESCIKNNNEICAKDTVTYCDNRAGTPRAIRKSGGYYEPGNTHADPSSGCVFDYREVSNKNSECAKSESKSGDVVYTTKEEAEKLDKERRDSLPEGQKGSSSGTVDSTTTACSPQACKAYNDAKVANNLARFYAIRNGAGGLCVPADLGVPVKDDVTVNGIEGRLMMCSSKSNPPELYWMIASYKDNSLIQVPEGQKTKPSVDTIETGFPNLQKARCAAGVDSGNICANLDLGNVCK